MENRNRSTKYSKTFKNGVYSNPKLHHAHTQKDKERKRPNDQESKDDNSRESSFEGKGKIEKGRTKTEKKEENKKMEKQP